MRCERAIAEDRAGGAVPVMIVATAGTTGAGMIDPLHACADIAAARTAFGITSMPPGAARRWPRIDCAGVSPASSAPTRSPSTPTNGWRPPWAARMFITRHGASVVRGLSRLDQLHAVECLRRRSLSEQRAMVAPLPGAALVPRLGGRRLGGVRRACGAQRRGRGAGSRSGCCALGWTIANDSVLAVLDAVPPAGLGDVRDAGAPGGGLGPGLGRAHHLRGPGCGADLRHERRDPPGGRRCVGRRAQ